MLAPRETTLELIDGPFESSAEYLEFQTLGDSTSKRSLNLEFVLNNTLLGEAARLFDRVPNNLLDAVGRRAAQLYGSAHE